MVVAALGSVRGAALESQRFANGVAGDRHDDADGARAVGHNVLQFRSARWLRGEARATLTVRELQRGAVAVPERPLLTHGTRGAYLAPDPAWAVHYVCFYDPGRCLPHPVTTRHLAARLAAKGYEGVYLPEILAMGDA